MQVDWPINDMLNYLGPLVTGLHEQSVVIGKWSSHLSSVCGGELIWKADFTMVTVCFHGCCLISWTRHVNYYNVDNLIFLWTRIRVDAN